MGQLIPPSTGVVYVDTNAIIYRVERIEPFLTISIPLWDALDAGLVSILTSDPDFRRVSGLTVAVLSEVAAS